jgi:arylsulfatase A-like enzyme
MITRLDAQVGRLLDELRRLKLERDTLVIFSSDNGPHKESNHDPEQLFHPSGSVRGYKRDLTDGGIRVPFIAWWPGTVAAGKVSDHVGYFGDLLATVADLAKVGAPPGRDSISLVPTLKGNRRGQKQHEFLYWEFHESGFSQAVLIDGHWKAIRMRSLDAPIQLYDLRTDPRELNDRASDELALVARARDLFQTARSNSPDWSPKPAARR